MEHWTNSNNSEVLLYFLNNNILCGRKDAISLRLTPSHNGITRLSCNNTACSSGHEETLALECSGQEVKKNLQETRAEPPTEEKLKCISQEMH